MNVIDRLEVEEIGRLPERLETSSIGSPTINVGGTNVGIQVVNQQNVSNDVGLNINVLGNANQTNNFVTGQINAAGNTIHF
jgi:hypothetical protein